MRAISIRQPWAWLILRPDLVGAARLKAIARNELKDIENRSWPTRFRGRVLIHASKGMTRAEYEDAQDPLWSSGGPTIELPPFEELQRGGIVGTVTIDDCVAAERRESWWHMGGCFGFHMVNAKAIPLIPCKGALGFFEIPEDVVATIRSIGDGDKSCLI